MIKYGWRSGRSPSGIAANAKRHGLTDPAAVPVPDDNSSGESSSSSSEEAAAEATEEEAPTVEAEPATLAQGPKHTVPRLRPPVG